MMPATIDLIVKLGGSAITDKSKLETLNEGAIYTAAELIKLCVERGLKCIVVHGAGSFGHHQATQFKVVDGFAKADNCAVTKKGFAVTRVSVLKLHMKVVECLITSGVPAVGLSPCGSWATKDREVSQSGMESINNFLQSGFLPVLHGDCVLDSVRGCTILSGDTVIKTICEEMTVKRVVFLTDVAGIYDRPPISRDAKLLTHIIIDESGKIQNKIKTDVLEWDCTGGIELKIKSAGGIVVQTGGQTSVFVCKLGSGVAKEICLGEVTDDIKESTVITLSKDR